MNLKVVIIEDEAPAFRRLQKILEEVEPQVEILEVLGSVEESASWLKSHDSPDLCFMDIQLSDGISFEVFERIHIKCPVIFTTAFDEYTLRAFQVNSVDYLLKPIKVEDLKRSLAKLNDFKNHFAPTGPDLEEVIRQIGSDGRRYKTRFLVKTGSKMVSVEAEKIAFFQTKHGVVHLTTKGNKTYFMDQALDELESILDPENFYRANRQFIVSFDAINAVHRYHKGKLLVETSPECTDEIVVSSEKAAKFKIWLDL